ncbi:FMN-binding domain-containing protein [Microbacterium hydrothermale]|uniref:FMN-binding protein n=1 Tax=Microbacterium hydrothermale TaxID=857427 RepID=UPI002225E58D|nr:FMN-binding protein [Microbacterium hydrothermale]MCW2164285.1 FMN-binding domain-containing protein [Microbacterium hydrothermale]
MKRIVYALMATVTGLVLLFSYRTSVAPEAASALSDVAPVSSGTTAAAPAPTPSSTATASPSASGSSGSAASGASSGSTSSGSTGQTPSSGLRDGTYTGAAANTRYGPVQVQITVSGGSITDVQVPEYPSSNGRDQQINSRALPTLMDETIQAQSAQVDMVSGATYTSTGYRTSLQSALDQARS